MEDLRIATQVMLGKLHSKVPIPYREEIASQLKGKKFKFGFYFSGESVFVGIRFFESIPHAMFM